MTPGARRLINTGVSGLTFLAAVLMICPLLLIFGFLLYQGLSALNVDFFLHLPKPVGEAGGGMANAIVGSLIMIGMAA
ncbi:MAG TPA: phosphate ABC transporter permease PtsA, partial [Methylomirabilota bacterium]